MKTSILCTMVAFVALAITTAPASAAEKYTQHQYCENCSTGGVDAYGANYGRCGPRCQAALAHPWHCNYYHTQWGSPVALVVPPTAEKQYSMGWGVGNTRLTRTYHQFGRPYPGTYAGEVGRRFNATPYLPSDTSQFGVYYVRGPW